MNEQELKHAFEDVLASSPPPSMDPSRALAVARKARSNRRSSLVGAVVAVAVVGIGIGSAFALNPQAATDMVMGAGQSSSSAPSRPKINPNTMDPTENINWSEQGDIDFSDPDKLYKQFSEELLVRLQTYGSQAGFQTGPFESQDPNWKKQQALHNYTIYERLAGQPQKWKQHTAHVPLRTDGKLGDLLAFVLAPKPQQDLCVQARAFMSNGNAPCQIIQVDGKSVAVASAPGRREAELWATYQAPDGITVTIGVASGHTLSAGTPPKLDAVPFTGEQLAALAVDPAFKPKP